MTNPGFTSRLVPALAALAVLLAGYVVWKLTREIGHRRAAEEKLREAHEVLELRVRERSADLARSNAALLVSQALYHSLVEQLPAGVFRKDLAGRYVFVNSRFCRLKDQPATEILGRTPRELAAYEATLGGTRPAEVLQQSVLAEQGADHHELILQTGEQLMVEEIYSRPDGTTQYFQAIKSPVFDAEKKIAGSQGILFDITERKRAEHALHRMEELYRRAIGGAGAVPYSNDFKTKSYLFLGEGIRQLIGYEPHEVNSALWNRIMLKSVMLGEAAGLDKAEAARRVLDGELRHWRCDMCVTTRDGQTRWISDASVQDLDEQGRPIFSIGILQDITERKQAEAELAYERQLLRALMDTSPDYIYFKDRESRFIRCSERQAQQFGLRSAEAAVGRSDADFFDEEHACEAFQDEQNILRTGQPLIAKIEKEIWRDGSVSWVLTSKLPLRDPAGEIIGTFGLSKDITAIKHAEARLAEAHAQLLETSRRAGMAEVATGVLHNVGNVLNSVNIAAGCIAENLRKSKAVNLPKLAALLREHEPDLGGFLTKDPRGGQVIGYLGQLAESITKEHEAALEELAELQKHIDHIKEIVAMQQSVAKASCVTEHVHVTELVEDALQINGDGLARNDIQITREFEDVPAIAVEKHKVLQILVNLVSNAKHACDAANRPDKRLTLRVKAVRDRIHILVADNGVGIPPENLTRIFAHGFTTRLNGHGFGLHSGALAAREIGGALSVQSGGADRGAVFTLEIPLKPAKSNHA